MLFRILIATLDLDDDQMEMYLCNIFQKLPRRIDQPCLHSLDLPSLIVQLFALHISHLALQTCPSFQIYQPKQTAVSGELEVRFVCD